MIFSIFYSFKTFFYPSKLLIFVYFFYKDKNTQIDEELKTHKNLPSF
ncbi:MAG: hypothetical protein RLZZ306_2099 [Bacteroidota bacterium]|jgi:hypothetical protein